jgi:hypothetical protein
MAAAAAAVLTAVLIALQVRTSATGYVLVYCNAFWVTAGIENHMRQMSGS